MIDEEERKRQKKTVYKNYRNFQDERGMRSDRTEMPDQTIGSSPVYKNKEGGQAEDDGIFSWLFWRARFGQLTGYLIIFLGFFVALERREIGPISAFHIQKGVSIVIDQEVDLLEGPNSSRIWLNVFGGCLSGAMAFEISYRSNDEFDQGLFVLAIISSLFDFFQAIIAVKFKSQWAFKTKNEKLTISRNLLSVFVLLMYV